MLRRVVAASLALALLAGCAGVRDHLLAAPRATGHACFLTGHGEVRAEPRLYLCVFDMTQSSPYWNDAAITVRIDEFTRGLKGARCKVVDAWEASDPKKNYEHAEYLEVRQLLCTFDGSAP